MPTELLAEIAISAPLRALRSVVRFDARRAACTRIQRTFRDWRRRSLPRDPSKLGVGDRVLVRRVPKQGVCIATAAVGLTEQIWKLRILKTDTYIESNVKYIYRLEQWGDGPQAQRVARRVATASAHEARGAAIQAASAAIATVRSAHSTPATNALAVAAASAASSAAAAATAAASATAAPATAANPTDQAEDESFRRASAKMSTSESAQLLEVAQMVQEAAGSVVHSNALSAREATIRGGDGKDAASMLAEVTSAAREATLQASAAASAVGVFNNAEELQMTAEKAVVATAAAAGQVASAANALSCAPGAAHAVHGATIAVTGALAEVGEAGRKLARALAQAEGQTVESSNASRAILSAQAAAEVAAAAEVDKGLMSAASQMTEKKKKRR